jgi:hypothetical protein
LLLLLLLLQGYSLLLKPEKLVDVDQRRVTVKGGETFGCIEIEVGLPPAVTANSNGKLALDHRTHSTLQPACCCIPGCSSLRNCCGACSKNVGGETLSAPVRSAAWMTDKFLRTAFSV